MRSMFLHAVDEGFELDGGEAIEVETDFNN